jgi:glycosyl transferase, family 25
MSVEILVISLPGAEARRRLVRAQLELPGMPPHRILDAVDGRQLGAAELAAVYDDAAARSHVGRALTGAEIGCAASHLSACRQVAAEAIGAAVILEDDALLGHQFLAVLERLLPMLDPRRPQAILLSHVHRYSAWRGRRVDRRHRLYRPYSAYGAHAYLVTRAAAQAMVARLGRVHTVADDWAYFAKSGILEVAAVVP